MNKSEKFVLIHFFDCSLLVKVSTIAMNSNSIKKLIHGKVYNMYGGQYLWFNIAENFIVFPGDALDPK